MKTEASEYMSLLQEIQNQNISTFTTVPVDEPRFVIETNSRTISVPSEFSFLSVQFDHKAETIYFEIDRYFDDIDLSQHTCVVQFINKSTSGINEGAYPVSAMDLDSVEGKIVFGWEIGNDATQLVGDVAFSVRFYSIDENGNFTYNFNTLPAHSNILETLNVSHDSEKITPSELEVWTAKMNFLTTNIEKDIASVEEKIQRLEKSISSIPEDYTALINEVGQLSSEVSNDKNIITDGFVTLDYNIIEDSSVNGYTGEIIKEYGIRRTDYIDVGNLECFYVLSKSTSTRNCFYDENKNFVCTFQTPKVDNPIPISVPKGVKYAILTIENSVWFDGIYKKINTIDRIPFTKYFKDDELSMGYINSSGGVYVHPQWVHTDYIFVPVSDEGRISTSCTIYFYAGIAFYDINKRCIGSVVGTNVSDYGLTEEYYPKVREITLPENTCFVRLSLYTYNGVYNANHMCIHVDYNIKKAFNNITRDSIYMQNKTKNTYVNASAKNTSKENKRFCMLCTTDLHGDEESLKRSVEYLNDLKCFDCAVTLGDSQPGNFNDNDGTWYTHQIKNANKSWLTVIGNHDAGLGKDTSVVGNVEQVYQKFIQPNLLYADVEDEGKCYYYKDFETYNLRLICLNGYDCNNNELDSDGKYIVAREIEYYSQEQISWLSDTLMNTPSNYHVMVLLHSTPAPATRDSSINFNSKIGHFASEGKQNGIVADIINAWINGTALSQEYVCSNQNLDNVNVNVDFTTRGLGNFICYVTGHIHTDAIGHLTNYPNQKILALSSTSTVQGQIVNDDLVREIGTKSQDCITSLAIDTQKKNIYIVRIGADMSYTFDKREPTIISYS